jgi:hypothetical protein
MRQMQFKFDGLPKEYRDGYPFEEGELILFMGEIENMPGHCVVVKRNGKVIWGYHTDHFFEVEE